MSTDSNQPNTSSTTTTEGQQPQGVPLEQNLSDNI